MNYKNCPKCNEANPPNMRFCGKCGADMTTADELPPTVFGMSPPIVPPPNFQPQQPAQTPPNFQPPQQNFQQQPNFQQPPPFQTTTPRSSSGKKIALSGGIIGLIVVIAGGFILWTRVIGPYFDKKAHLEKERTNQTRADSTTAMSLLPEDGSIYTSGFQKGKTLDKMQLLQASQNLPPELKSELNNINDATAAEYVRKEDSSQKFLLQILKYNSPAQAAAVCDKVGEALRKNEASLKFVLYHFSGLSSPDECKVEAEDKNKGATKILSRYGFLIIASGHTDNVSRSLLDGFKSKLER